MNNFLEFFTSRITDLVIFQSKDQILVSKKEHFDFQTNRFIMEA